MRCCADGSICCDDVCWFGTGCVYVGVPGESTTPLLAITCGWPKTTCVWPTTTVPPHERTTGSKPKPKSASTLPSDSRITGIMVNTTGCRGKTDCVMNGDGVVTITTGCGSRAMPVVLVPLCAGRRHTPFTC